MKQEDQILELKKTLRELAEEEFILEIPLAKEDADAKEEPV